MLQAAILDCVPFDPFSFQQNGYAPGEGRLAEVSFRMKS